MTAPKPATTSTTGPILLTFSGVVWLLLGAVAAVLVVRSFVAVIPVDVLASDGSAGSGIQVTVESPGVAEVELAAGTGYTLFLARPAPADDTGLAGEVTVRGPSGEPVDVTASEVELHATSGGMTARSIGAFATTDQGTYTITAPSMHDGSAARVMVGPGEAFLPFFTQLLTAMLSLMGVLVLVPIGVGSVIGGAFWWRARLAARMSLPPTGR